VLTIPLKREKKRDRNSASEVWNTEDYYDNESYGFGEDEVIDILPLQSSEDEIDLEFE